MDINIKLSQNGRWLLTFRNNIPYVYDSIEEVLKHIQALMETEHRVSPKASSQEDVITKFRTFENAPQVYTVE